MSERRYGSSPVYQLLSRLCLAEKSWHSNHKFTDTAPDKLRLQAQLRSTVLKVEVADVAGPSRAPTMMAGLARMMK